MCIYIYIYICYRKLRWVSISAWSVLRVKLHRVVIQRKSVSVDGNIYIYIYICIYIYIYIYIYSCVCVCVCVCVCLCFTVIRLFFLLSVIMCLCISNIYYPFFADCFAFFLFSYSWLLLHVVHHFYPVYFILSSFFQHPFHKVSYILLFFFLFFREGRVPYFPHYVFIIFSIFLIFLFLLFLSFPFTFFSIYTWFFTSLSFSSLCLSLLVKIFILYIVIRLLYLGDDQKKVINPETGNAKTSNIIACLSFSFQ